MSMETDSIWILTVLSGWLSHLKPRHDYSVLTVLDSTTQLQDMPFMADILKT